MRGGRSRSHGQVIKTKITKSSVEDIITNSRYDICQWKKKRCRIYEMPIAYHARSFDSGKKIGWKDGVAAIWYILKYNWFC